MEAIHFHSNAMIASATIAYDYGWLMTVITIRESLMGVMAFPHIYSYKYICCFQSENNIMPEYACKNVANSVSPSCSLC